MERALPSRRRTLFNHLCSAELRHETGLPDPGLAGNRDNPSRAVDEAMDLER